MWIDKQMYSLNKNIFVYCLFEELGKIEELTRVFDELNNFSFSKYPYLYSYLTKEMEEAITRFDENKKHINQYYRKGKE